MANRSLRSLSAIADGTPLAFPSSWSCLSPLWRKRTSCMLSFHPSSMYAYTVHVKRFMVEATVTPFVTVGFSFDDEPTVNSKNELTVATSGPQDLRRRSV